MKTLRPPKCQPTDTFDVECCNVACGALLRVARIELKWVTDVREGGYWSFECPHCKRDITIAGGKLEGRRTAETQPHGWKT